MVAVNAMAVLGNAINDARRRYKAANPLSDAAEKDALQ